MLARLRRLFGRENGERRGSRERSAEAGLQSLGRRSRKRWSWGRRRTTGEPVSSLPHLTEQQVNEQVEKLTAQLQLMTSERDELRDRLAFSTKPFVLDESLNPDNERLRVQHLYTMVDLQDLQREHTEVSEKCRKQVQETTFFRNFHRELLKEKSLLKDKVEMQSRKNRKLLLEQNVLQKSSEERDRVCEEKQKKICDLQAQQQQEKRERKLRYLLRGKELLTEQRDVALQMGQYFTNSEIRFKHLKEELEQINAENENLLMEIEWLKMSAEYARHVFHPRALSSKTLRVWLFLECVDSNM